MGNEASQLSGLEMEEKATEITDFWAHHQATVRDRCRYFSLKGDGSVSIFKGEAVLGPLWSVSTPLEKCSNNLLKYRHPCILRYISAWQQRSTLHLATEYVIPLSQALNTQTPLQICVGLHSILEALVFLHEQAGVSHNNVSISAVYVTGDGQWKLGGLQYLCPFKELTSAYLKHARIHRYDKSVDPNEASYETTSKVDQYAFAAFVEDLYRDKKNDEVPYLSEFRKYCHDFLQHINPEKRPNLSQVLQHDFFNHDFITIYKFLNFLPLKNEEEKQRFFSNILDNLRCFDEETVAKQFSGLFLSRVTMLDNTARKDVIPYIFEPRNDRIQGEKQSGFFSLSVFKEHIKPRLLQLFAVRDTQIRMMLLLHFSKFVHVFSHDELSQSILPELLLGIKDTDDNLVSSTLVCLSELVPILGAATIIGGKRSKLFTDGRPNCTTVTSSNTNRHAFLPPKSLKDFSCSEEILANSHNFDKTLILDERPSPVGGEDVETENNTILKDVHSQDDNKCSDDDWSDWDNTNRQLVIADDIPSTTDSYIVPEIDKDASKSTIMQKAAIQAKTNVVDINELDIKTKKIESPKLNSQEEYDFFADMTPVIEKPTTTSMAEHGLNSKLSNKLSFVPDSMTDEMGDWEENWN